MKLTKNTFDSWSYSYECHRRSTHTHVQTYRHAHIKTTFDVSLRYSVFENARSRVVMLFWLELTVVLCNGSQLTTSNGLLNLLYVVSRPATMRIPTKIPFTIRKEL